MNAEDPMLAVLRAHGATHYYRDRGVAFGYRTAPIADVVEMCQFSQRETGEWYAMYRGEWVTREGGIPQEAQRVEP